MKKGLVFVDWIRERRRANAFSKYITSFRAACPELAEGSARSTATGASRLSRAQPRGEISIQLMSEIPRLQRLPFDFTSRLRLGKAPLSLGMTRHSRLEAICVCPDERPFYTLVLADQEPQH